MHRLILTPSNTTETIDSPDKTDPKTFQRVTPIPCSSIYTLCVVFLIIAMNSYHYLFKFIVIGDTRVEKSCVVLQFIENKTRSAHDVTIGV